MSTHLSSTKFKKTIIDKKGTCVSKKSMQERKKSMELSELSSMIAVSQKSSTHFSQESLRGCDIYFTRDCENFYTDKNLQEKNRWNYQFGSFTPLGHIYQLEYISEMVYTM